MSSFSLGDEIESITVLEKMNKRNEAKDLLNKESLGSNHPDTLTSMNTLAELYSMQGKVNAWKKLMKK